MITTSFIFDILLVAQNLNKTEFLNSIIETGKDISPNTKIERAITPGKTYSILYILPRTAKINIGKITERMGPKIVLTKCKNNVLKILNIVPAFFSHVFI